MKQMMTQFQESSPYKFYRSFTPASRAVILFALPFTLVDAVHYLTAGTALSFSLLLVALIYLLCGGVAAHIASREGVEIGKLPLAGRSAGLRLWLTSTLVNVLVSVFLGFVSLGITIITGAVYLCLSAPLHALGSALFGWLGGWLYQQYALRTRDL